MWQIINKTVGVWNNIMRLDFNFNTIRCLFQYFLKEKNTISLQPLKFFFFFLNFNNFHTCTRFCLSSSFRCFCSNSSFLLRSFCISFEIGLVCNSDTDLSSDGLDFKSFSSSIQLSKHISSSSLYYKILLIIKRWMACNII